MQNLKSSVRRNCLLLSSLSNQPGRLRVVDVHDAVLPRLAHDAREYFVSLQRRLTCDGREEVSLAITVTIRFLADLQATEREFVDEILALDLVEGLEAFANTDVRDLNVSLCRDNNVSLIKALRRRA